MRLTRLLTAILLSTIAFPCFAAEPTRDEVLNAAKEAQITPISGEVKVDAEKAALGEKLYHDTILSADGTVSCATCHELTKGGTDRMATSKGIKNQHGPINSPTVFNSEHNFVQFWDGRAKDLAEQAQGPVENPLEMGAKWVDVEKKVADSADYKPLFEKLYGGQVTKDTIANAIAEFERTLVTPNCKLDQYLNGDDSALTASEKRGLVTFVEKGCATCHSGPYLGGNSYQVLNPDYFTDRGTKMTDADMGRFNVTKKEEDRHAFKVPMLRNVEVTAPYLHDGSAKNLRQAVNTMAKYQLGETLTTQETDDIVAFLKTLTGEYKGEKLKP